MMMMISMYCCSFACKSVPVDKWSCPWCNGYRRRKWTRRHEFKPWARLIEFSIAHSTLGKGINPIILPPAKGK